MNEQINWNSLEHARRMGLDYTPATPTAVALCEALGDTLTALETHRKNQRRGHRKKAFNETAGAAVADLLKAAQHDAGRWSWRVLTTASFTDAPVSYTDFTSVLKSAEAGQLIEKQPGHYQRFEFPNGVVGQGKATRFRPTAKLFTLAAEHGVTPENIDEHFERQLPTLPAKPLELRGSSTRIRQVKFKGRSLPFERTARTDRMETDVRELNHFLAGRSIDGGIHRGYKRIFNEGDRQPYRWNKGGRLYSIGEDSYPTLKKGQRLGMMLDGEPVAEIDIRASFLTLLHGLKGVPFDACARDPYQIMSAIPREVVKAWVTMTLGHTKFHRRWPTAVAKELVEAGIDLWKAPIKELAPVVLHFLPVLKDWPTQKITCFDLMYLESEAVIGTMLELMRDHDIPSLSVHDSLIVPIGRIDQAGSILGRRYTEMSGISPYLRINKADSPAA